MGLAHRRFIRPHVMFSPAGLVAKHCLQGMRCSLVADPRKASTMFGRVDPCHMFGSTAAREVPGVLQGGPRLNGQPTLLAILPLSLIIFGALPITVAARSEGGAQRVEVTALAYKDSVVPLMDEGSVDSEGLLLFGTPVLRRHFSAGHALNSKVSALVLQNFQTFLRDSRSWNSRSQYDGYSEERRGSRTNDFYTWYADGDENRFLQFPENQPLLSPLFEFIKDSVVEWYNMLGYHKRVRALRKQKATARIYFTPIWPAVQHAGTVHEVHNHTGVDISGVYFARVPRSQQPSLHLHDPRPVGIDWNMPAGSPVAKVMVPAREGDLVMFPPWVGHSVERHAEDRKYTPEDENGLRVTISFNIQIGESNTKSCRDCMVSVRIFHESWRQGAHAEL